MQIDKSFIEDLNQEIGMRNKADYLVSFEVSVKVECTLQNIELHRKAEYRNNFIAKGPLASKVNLL